MPERPLLMLPSPAVPLRRGDARKFPFKLHHPSRNNQATRLTPVFMSLLRTFAQIRAEAFGAMPEEVLVLETNGPIDQIVNTIKRIEGMEWLGEIELDQVPADEDYYYYHFKNNERNDGIKLSKRLFMVFTNQKALKRLLTMWNKWKRDKELGWGLGRFKELFILLSDVRRWGVEDRLAETGIRESWREWVDNNQQLIPFQIELWYRDKEDTRTAERNSVVELIIEMGGQLVNESVIKDIAYHALLVNLSRESIVEIIDKNEIPKLLKYHAIQYLRPSGQMAISIEDGISAAVQDIPVDQPSALGEPVIALFDGMPLQNHNLLRDRLNVDDPDGFESSYVSGEREHGTAMSSLILKGDLSGSGTFLKNKLYVRPIMIPDPRDWRSQFKEVTIPHNVLEVDLLHRAVKRLFENDGQVGPVASKVCIINLSIGIYSRVFEHTISPFAKLIDWLSWNYKVLFVLSAGNHLRDVLLDVKPSELSQIPPNQIQEKIIKAIVDDSRNRGLLSPAESLNGITVGAQHSDLAGNFSLSSRFINPFIDANLPNVISAHGFGYRRSIKPDILLPGGRTLLNEPILLTEMNYSVTKRSLSPGQKVAAPGAVPGDVSNSKFSCGTSNSTALATRLSGELYDVLLELRSEPGGELLDRIPKAVLLKALLVHGASWNLAINTFKKALGLDSNSQALKNLVSRILGYGFVDSDYSKECTKSRVTTLGGGELGKDESHIHEIPLPNSLSGKQYEKRVTVTLAWNSPINPKSQKYRKANLWFEAVKNPLNVTGKEAGNTITQRGTVQHEIFENDQIVLFENDDCFVVQVNCRQDSLTLGERVPYTLVTTIEVKNLVDIGVDIYNEVKVKVQNSRIRVGSQG